MSGCEACHFLFSLAAIPLNCVWHLCRDRKIEGGGGVLQKELCRMSCGLCGKTCAESSVERSVWQELSRKICVERVLDCFLCFVYLQ